MTNRRLPQWPNGIFAQIMAATMLIVATLGAAHPADAYPQLTLSTSVGETGTFVVVHGTGFPVYGGPGQVWFDQNLDNQMNYYNPNDTKTICGLPGFLTPCEPGPTNVMTDSTGSFTASLIIPPGKNASFLGAGLYFIGANVNLGGGTSPPNGARAPFRVPATFSVSPASSLPSQSYTVTVTGGNFTPFNYPNATTQYPQSNGIVWVDSNNDFVPGSDEPKVQVWVLPDGSLSACPTSSCFSPITLKFGPLPLITCAPSGLCSWNPGANIRVKIFKAGDEQLSYEQQIDAAALFRVQWR